MLTFISEQEIFTLGLIQIVHIKPKTSDRKGKEMITYFAIDRSVGSKYVALKYDIIPPQAKTDSHAEAHPTDAIIYMISGELTFYVTAPEKKSHKIRAGDFVFVPAGETHYAQNYSKTNSAEAIVCIPAPSFTN
ncbi:MAG: cupin domain-containing protein [Thaumarchaeota archaeon]|nr:cupin domain-containing protein [Nitrososphaerota archaeon]